MRQGENGCPSEVTTRFALPNHPWTEFSQAKWDLRRMLGDLGHDVEPAVFTICDFNHIGREINRKGLLWATADKKVEKIKLAYYSVQNAVAVFDDTLERVKEPVVAVMHGKATASFAYRNRQTGQHLIALWDNSGTPDDAFVTRPAQVVVKGLAMKDPVWVDRVCGRIHEIPANRIVNANGFTIFKEVPLYDAPGRKHLLSTTLWAEGSVLNQQKLLTIPEGAIIVFADNSPGWKWQQDFFSTPRNSKNSYGVYCHHALWGSGPHLAQVPSPHRTFECLRTAVEHGAGTYAICNIPNVREFVLGVDATAKMTWQLPGFDPEAWLACWVRERFSVKQEEIATAYRAYFSTWQIHEARQVPFLMDGQMASLGNSSLNQLTRKLAKKADAVGTATKEAPSAAKAGDAFWNAIGDMHPASSRGEIIKRVALQQAGFSHVAAQARAAAAALPEAEAALLRDNLIFQSASMQQMSAWLEQVELAHEALDRGDIPACAEALASAEAAFAQIPVLAADYCRGPWANWYRGAKKLNITATLQRTRAVLLQVQQSAAKR